MKATRAKLRRLYPILALIAVIGGLHHAIYLDFSNSSINKRVEAKEVQADYGAIEISTTSVDSQQMDSDSRPVLEVKTVSFEK